VFNRQGPGGQCQKEQPKDKENPGDEPLGMKLCHA